MNGIQEVVSSILIVSTTISRECDIKTRFCKEASFYLCCNFSNIHSKTELVKINLKVNV